MSRISADSTIDYNDAKSASQLSMHSGSVKIKKSNNKTCGLTVTLIIAVIIIGVLSVVLIYKEVNGNCSKIGSQSQANTEKCAEKKYVRSKDEKFHLLSTTTSYEDSFKDEKEWLAHFKTAVPNECTPVRFFLMGRHGSRTTSFKYKAKFDELYKKLQKSSKVKPWTDNMMYNQMLVERGIEEWKSIGRRFAKRYPQLVNKETELVIKTSVKYRTTESANSFVMGLSENSNNPIKASIATDNRITRFWENCPIVEEITDSDKLKEPSKEFMQSEVVQYAAKQMSLRLFSNESMITPDDMKVIKRACAYDHLAFGSSINTWCELLSMEDLKLIDYATALEKWYRFGPAIWSLYSQSCYLMDYILNHMDKAINDLKDKTFGHLIFGHAETLIPVMTVLNVFGPLPMENTTISTIEKFQKSQFDLSRKLPMASNVALVLHKCASEYSVMMFFKEIPTPIPLCKSDDLMCSFAKFKQLLKQSSTCAPAFNSCPPNYYQ